MQNSVRGSCGSGFHAVVHEGGNTSEIDFGAVGVSGGRMRVKPFDVVVCR